VRSPLVALAGIVCLAACGGDEGPSADEYRVAAERACATATADARRVPAPSDSAPSVAAYSAAILPIRRREAGALRALTPPDDLANAHDDLVQAADAMARKSTSLTSRHKH
jgi:hypothetical protein